MNPATEQFIKDAIAGGWKADTFKHHKPPKPDFTMLVFQAIDEETGAIVMQMRFAEILLDPLAWRAVSRKRDWSWGSWQICPTCDDTVMAVDWRFYMHQFVEDIAMGRTTEEALTRL